MLKPRNALKLKLLIIKVIVSVRLRVRQFTKAKLLSRLTPDYFVWASPSIWEISSRCLRQVAFAEATSGNVIPAPKLTLGVNQ